MLFSWSTKVAQEIPPRHAPGSEPAPDTRPLITEADKEEWLSDMRASKGEEWVRQNWARLEEEWAYIQSLV
jgi:hypothetical protein